MIHFLPRTVKKKLFAHIMRGSCIKLSHRSQKVSEHFFTIMLVHTRDIWGYLLSLHSNQSIKTNRMGKQWIVYSYSYLSVSINKTFCTWILSFDPERTKHGTVQLLKTASMSFLMGMNDFFGQGQLIERIYKTSWYGYAPLIVWD